MQTFAINGFGRIGRLTARIWYENHKDNISLAAINTSGSMDLSGWAHLFRYDTAYSKMKDTVEIEEHQGKQDVSDEDPLLGHLIIGGNTKIPVLAQRSPEKIPWGDYNIDLVVEATGVFRTEETASKHLEGGAKKVLLAAPGKGGQIETRVLGVSEGQNKGDIYSNASCTTNCTAPVIAVLQASLGIEKAMLTTIHAYTDDQKLQDGSHKDIRRARAAAQNIIPTTTGAAKATTEVVPGLEGKFDGMAIRVPVITGSLTDITALVKKNTTKEEVNQAMIDASEGRWKGIIATTDEPLVSSDIIGRTESAIVDLDLTNVVDGNLVKIIAWYDNEWGFTSRLVEMVGVILSGK